MSNQRFAKKVLLIGWDAADWKVISPLMDAGLMPNLEGLVNEGVMGNIATLDPPLSPMLWTSVATGKTADKHGILGFTQPDPDNKGLRPVLGTSRKVKAVWNILNQKGMRCHVVGWWPSHPAEPLNGVTVSNFYHRATVPYGEPWPLPPKSVHPEAVAKTLADLRVHPAELTAAHILPFVPLAAEIDPEEDKVLPIIAKTIADCASVHGAATWLMENEPWDFMAVYYDAIDHFGHGFMKFHPPKRDHIPEEKFRLFNGVITAAYRFHDMMLGRLLKLAGSDTTVILISDHGFHPDHLRPKGIPKEPAGPAIEHRPYGILCMRGPHLQQDERIYGASLLDIAPTILTLFGLPVAADMDGKVLVQAFTDPPMSSVIPSWEEVEGEAGMYPDEMRRDPWAEQEMMQQLVALGYVSMPTGDQQAFIDKQVRESQFWLARVYVSRRRFEEAIPILEQLYRQAPDQKRYGFRLADSYRSAGRLHDCRRILDEMIAAGGKSTPPLDLLQGMLLIQEKRPEEALTYLQRAAAQNQQNPAFHFHLGRAYLHLKAWSEAEGAFLQTLQLDSDRAEAHHGLAQVYLRQGMHEEAAEAALDAVGLIYFQPAAHFHLGEALMGLGYYKQAAEAYHVAKNQAPGMRRAYLRLAHLYDTFLERPDEAAVYRRFAEERIEAE